MPAGVRYEQLQENEFPASRSAGWGLDGWVGLGGLCSGDAFRKRFPFRPAGRQNRLCLPALRLRKRLQEVRFARSLPRFSNGSRPKAPAPRTEKRRVCLIRGGRGSRLRRTSRSFFSRPRLRSIDLLGSLPLPRTRRPWTRAAQRSPYPRNTPSSIAPRPTSW